MTDPWTPRLLPFPSNPLPEAMMGFLADQARDWPRLGEARAALADVHTRTIRLGRRTVVVQWNPARAASTTARVDSAGVQARACFLCPEHLPAEERGIPWGEDLVILANPAPILPDHLVISWRTHRAQHLPLALDDLLRFARAASPRFSVLYNGPRCGASAPDHLHLQAITANKLPSEVFARAAHSACDPRAGCLRCATACGAATPGRPLLHTQVLNAWSLTEQDPGAWLFQGPADAVRDAILAAVDVMDPPPGEEEPPFNLLAWATGDILSALLYPRAAHRPACFFAPEPDRCVVSPGTVDMAGFIVTVREQDFRRLDASLLAAIYAEVSPPLARFEAWEAELRRRLHHG